MNHYGVWISPDVAITGVVNNTGPEFFIEDCMYNAIDLDCLECREKAEEKDYAHFGLSPDDDVDLENMCDGCDGGTHTLLVGSWILNEDGKYIPDENGEYAAISREIYAQIVWSKYTRKCVLCSPCYPGQGDLDTKGEYLTYDLPPDMWGSTEH